MRITSSYVPTRVTKKFEDNTLVEKQWHQLKEVFVNQIYSDAKQNAGLHFRSFILESYYNWVVESRGAKLDTLKISLRHKVLWFLKELTEVVPNPPIMEMDQLMDFNKQKLLKQYLFTKMDIIVLNMKAIARTLKTMMPVSPSAEQLDKIYELDIAQTAHYKFMRQLLPSIFDIGEEIIMEHLIFLDRVNIAVHKEYHEIIEGARKNSEKLVTDKNSYYDIMIDR